MKRILTRVDRGAYQYKDESGLPKVTLFLDEEWVDDNGDPTAVKVEFEVVNERAEA